MNSKTTIILLMLAMVPGCAADGFNRGMFVALRQKQCLDATGQADCDRRSDDYDAYRRQRQQRLGAEGNE